MSMKTEHMTDDWISSGNGSQQDITDLRDKVIRLERENTSLAEELQNLIQGIEEWCADVANDSSWDGWDDNYKHYAYHGGLASAKAVLNMRKDGSGK